ncbi:MAG: glycyl radical protein [Bacteroidetes bacterium]|jgi:pyruvate formate-lyase/glycerol dehydratase family glycyl radical enzyme|nr:glycyl radical protein [Bacteroidota bacterium]
MDKRIAKLRENSLLAIPTISAERALLITEYFTANPFSHAVAVQRAEAFKYLLDNKHICIQENELIVGERGPAPKATPTYPEISLHSLEDLELLDQREKVSFKVDQSVKNAYQDKIIPFWQGLSQRDKIFSAMTHSWKQAYSAGIFTEFQEQRAPGHTVAGKRLFNTGLLDILEEIRWVRKTMAARGIAQSSWEELEAMEIAAQAMIDHAKRHADELRKQLKNCSDEPRKSELRTMISVCEKVPAHAPQSFHEALQHYWFIHMGIITELNPWDSFNPGRLDQHLWPFYQREIADGSLSKAHATALLQAFWIKFNNHPAPPKVGVTALESNTYTDFALINLGGLTESGADAVNELTYLILDVIKEMRLLQPSSMVQVSKKNPDLFIKSALKITKTGFGQPSFFNTDAIIQQLLRQGKSIEDARNGGASGCVETGAFGTEAYTLSGYFNLNKVLELTLHEGFDPRLKQQIGIKTPKLSAFKTFEELYAAFEQQLNHFIAIKIEGNNCIEELFAHHMPVPFMSLFIEDCVANAKDYNEGGARYNTSYLQGVGLGSITDSFAALKKWVFDSHEFDANSLLDAMQNNFTGHEPLRAQLVFHSPKWGNNDAEADQHAVRVFNSFLKAVDGKPSYRGGVFRINMLPTTSHVYFGSVTAAMPDGREAWKPLSEGISPVQGADIHGPVAVLQSAAKIDHIKTGGTLMNQKFAPEFFDSEEAIDKLCSMIRSYFRLDGHHIQFNVVDAQTLRKAQKNPEAYRDLIVRVAGYSDYFNDLGTDLQNEIIARTAHKSS